MLSFPRLEDLVGTAADTVYNAENFLFPHLAEKKDIRQSFVILGLYLIILYSNLCHFEHAYYSCEVKSDRNSSCIKGCSVEPVP